MADEGRVQTISEVDEGSLLPKEPPGEVGSVYSLWPCQLSHEGQPAVEEVSICNAHFVPALCAPVCSTCRRCTNAFALAQGCHNTEFHVSWISPCLSHLFSILDSSLVPSVFFFFFLHHRLFSRLSSCRLVFSSSSLFRHFHVLLLFSCLCSLTLFLYVSLLTLLSLHGPCAFFITSVSLPGRDTHTSVLAAAQSILSFLFFLTSLL